MVYSLIKHHYEIPLKNGENRFLYYKTIDISKEGYFEWNKIYSLSQYLKENLIEMNCGILDSIFDSHEVKTVNEKFLNLSIRTLDENRFVVDILNKKLLDR